MSWPYVGRTDCPPYVRRTAELTLKPAPVGCLLSVCLALAGTLGTQGAVEYVAAADARPLFTDLRPTAIPDELRAATALDTSSWTAWIRARDQVIRARLARGDEDTVVLWMGLGRTFTPQPPISEALSAGDAVTLTQVVQARARDFLAALAMPSSAADERAAFARDLLAARGHGVDSDAARLQTSTYLIQRLADLLREQRALATKLQAAGGDAATLFSDRGLSLDTSFPPGLAIDNALSALHRAGGLRPGSVRRVAIVGPGLDFADKDSGWDFYPPQTLQPFAVFESLVRLGLADAAALEITTLDVSPRVSQHLSRARARAAASDAYRIYLARDRRPWTAAANEYWRTFGGLIGKPAALRLTPPTTSIEVRAIDVAPDIVSRIAPMDVNVVTQRLVDRRFDLIVATNVLVYYDVFEQALAALNLASMLEPGGFLLSNTAIVELPSMAIRSVGESKTTYSAKPGDGDRIVHYRRR